MSALFTRKNCDLIAVFDGSVLNLSLESTELMVRTADTLYRHVKSFFFVALFDIYIFQIGKQDFAVVPADVLGSLCDVVAFRCRYRNDLHMLKTKFAGKFCDLFFDCLEFLLVISDQIHFVYCKYKITDSHQGADSCMASGLYQHALGCIYEDNCKVCKGCAYSHVSCILFVTRCISYDKASVVSCEVTVCNVDGNTLFTLFHQSVKKQGVVNLTAAASYSGIQLQRFLLICIEQFGVV